MKELIAHSRFWLLNTSLAMLLLPSASVAQQGERWTMPFQAAEKFENEGQFDKAVVQYEAALKDLRKASQRAKEDQNSQTATEAQKAKARERLSALLLKTAEVDLSLATLLMEGASGFPGVSSKVRARDLYVEAIHSAEGDPSLRFRACNDYAVFLLRQEQFTDARIVLDNTRKGLETAGESSNLRADETLAPLRPGDTGVSDHTAPCLRLPRLLEPNARALSAYLYNYGQALEQGGNPVEALDYYRDAFLRDPTFRPAEEAAARLAQEAEPAQGIEVLRQLAERSLEELSFTRAERHLETVIQKTEWSKDAKLPEVLATLVRLLTLETLERESFDATWKRKLEDLRARSTSEVAARADSILRVYSGSLPRCSDPDQLPRDHRIWAAGEGELFSDFLKMIADQASKNGEDLQALDGYLLAACFNLYNEDNALYLASLLLASPDLRLDSPEGDLSHELYAVVGDGYAALGKVDLASENLKKAQRLEQDELTIRERVAGLERFVVARFQGVPNSRGSLSLTSLVASNTLASHLCVADSDGGQKDAVTFAGASSANSSVAVDQVVITGLVEPEAAPTYYAIDALESIDVVADGSDMARSSSGLYVNLVTKNPGDRWKGSGSYLFLPEPVNETLGRQAVEFAPAQEPVVTNRIRDNRELGVQAGGDFRRDKLFAWFSYNESELSMSTFGGDRFENHLETTAGKLLSTLSGKDSITLSASLGEGRDRGLGAGLTRSRGTTLDQDSDSKIFKAEYTRKIHRWDLVGYHSRIRSDLSFSPLFTDGDMVLGASGVWRGTFRNGLFESEAEQTELRLIHSYETEKDQGIQNTFNLGGRLQSTRSAFESRFGWSNSVFIAGENLDTGFHVARFYRSGNVRTEESADAFWAQDTFNYGEITLDLGLRYDRQQGRNRGASVAANPVIPNLLPAVETDGAEVIDWESLTPRVGVAYKPDRLSGETIFRASYARFASALQTRYIQRTNAAFPAYAQFSFEDLDGDDALDPGESGSLRFLAPFGFDPLRAGTGSANVIDPDLEPEMTDEGVLGVEQKLAGNIEMGLSATYRRVSNILELRDFVRDGTGNVRLANRSDYVFDRIETVTLPDGSSSTVSSYTLRPGVAFTGGSLLVNGDRTQEYLGIKLNVSRPLGERGSLRGVFAWEESWWRIGSQFRAFDDPTDAGQSLDPSGISRADDDDDIVIPQSPRFDAQSSPFSNAEWSFNLNGSFELRKGSGIMVGTNVNYHDGFPLPYFATVLPPDGLEREIQVVSQSDSVRLPDLLVIDLRLQKTFIRGDTELTLGLDGFNVLNEGTALQRIRQLNGPQPDFLAKTLNPRTIRLGLQVAFGNTD